MIDTFKKWLVLLTLAVVCGIAAPTVAASGFTGETSVAIELGVGQTGRMVLANTVGYEVAGFQLLFTVENERPFVPQASLLTTLDVSATRRLVADVDLILGSRVRVSEWKPTFYGMVIWPW